MSSKIDKRIAFGVKVLNSQHKDIRRLKREGFEAELHGNKCWNSSFLIMDYLRKNPPKKNLRILEIGCGWGLLGIYCAKKFDAKVTGIDADKNVLPYLDIHSRLNKVNVKGKKMSFQQLSTPMLAEFDVILGADICYWDELTPLLYNLIRRAKRAHIQEIIIADPCRAPFTALAEKCKQKYTNVALIEKHISRPVNTSGEILIVR